MVVKYIVAEVRAGRRFDRSFLLTEAMFFNHTRFADDLGLAWKKDTARKRTPARETPHTLGLGGERITRLDAGREPETPEMREQISKGLAALAESLKGGKA